MAQEGLRIEELELVGSDGAFSDEGPAPVGSTPRRVVASVLGLVAIAACVAVAFLGGAPESQASNVHSALGLLDHPDIHGVVASNLLKSRRLLGVKETMDDKEMRRFAAEQLHKYSEMLKESQPDLYRALKNTPITTQHQRAVVHASGYRSDKRMQRIGLAIAHALADAKTTDPEKLKLHLAKALSPHREELTQLRKEVFPDPEMRALLGTSSDGESLKHLLHPDRIKLMGTVKGWDKYFSTQTSNLRRLSTWGSPTTPTYTQAARQSTYTQPATQSSSQGGWSTGATYAGASAITTTNHPLATTEITLGMINAALEEAGCVLRVIKPITKEFKDDLNVPPDVTSAIGGLSAIIGITDCEINAAMDDYDPVEMGGCPLEFGSEAFDAMREVFTVLGILGDNNPKDGVQGNHNNEKQVHEGVLDDKDSIFGIDAK